MSINSEISKLKEADIWSLLMFVLFKVKDTNEYSAISELAYVLDKRNMLKLCEYFGGCTITIPTIDELECLIYGLLVYQYVDVEKIDYNEALSRINSDGVSLSDIKDSYKNIKSVLDGYEISSRSVG